MLLMIVSLRYAVVTTISWNPDAARDRRTYSMQGLPATGIMGFGRLYVRGLRRGPPPPARAIALLRPTPPPPLPGGARGLLSSDQVAGLASFRALRGPLGEDLLPHLDDLRVDLVRLRLRIEVRLVLLVPFLAEGCDRRDEGVELLVERAGLVGRLDGGLVLPVRMGEQLRDRRVHVLDLLEDPVLLRLEAFELPHLSEAGLEVVEELVLLREGQGRRLLTELHRRDLPLRASQLLTEGPAHLRPEPPSHLDEGLRLLLECVPPRAVGAGLPDERRALALELPEPPAQLAFLLVDEVPLLAQDAALVVEGVPLLEEALELDLRFLQLRKTLLADQGLPRGDDLRLFGEPPLSFRPRNRVRQESDLLRAEFLHAPPEVREPQEDPLEGLGGAREAAPREAEPVLDRLPAMLEEGVDDGVEQVRVFEGEGRGPRLEPHEGGVDPRLRPERVPRHPLEDLALGPAVHADGEAGGVRGAGAGGHPPGELPPVHEDRTGEGGRGGGGRG